jgi:XTP/dITP diphosphohydrolase
MRAVRLVIGTTNPAKLRRYQTILERLTSAGGPIPPLEMLSLRDLPATVQAVQVEEDGATALENARKKARTYACASGLPTLGIDEALMVTGLAPDEQPGVYVRRFQGVERTDEELLDAFVELVRRLPADARQAIWTYAYCLALPSGLAHSSQVEVQCIFADAPRLPILPGYPLSSLLMDPALGKALRDLTPEEEEIRLAPVYAAVRQLFQASARGLGAYADGGNDDDR